MRPGERRERASPLGERRFLLEVGRHREALPHHRDHDRDRPRPTVTHDGHARGAVRVRRLEQYEATEFGGHVVLHARAGGEQRDTPPHVTPSPAPPHQAGTRNGDLVERAAAPTPEREHHAHERPQQPHRRHLHGEGHGQPQHADHDREALPHRQAEHEPSSCAVTEPIADRARRRAHDGSSAVEADRSSSAATGGRRGAR